MGRTQNLELSMSTFLFKNLGVYSRLVLKVFIITLISHQIFMFSNEKKHAAAWNNDIPHPTLLPDPSPSTTGWTNWPMNVLAT